MHRIASGLSAGLLFSSSVLAHPGHGVTEPNSVAHYLLEPFHIGPVVILAAAIGAFWLKHRRSTRSMKSEPARKQSR